MKTNFLILITFLLGFTACKNEQKTTTTSSTTATAAGVVPKPEGYLYLVTANNLRLRSEPNQKSTVVTQFKDVDFVSGNGEVSSNIDSIQLGGAIYKEPYYKVTSTTPEQQTGWLFGGGIRCVYAGPNATSPNLGTLVQFATFIKTLNKNKPESGKLLWEYVEKNFSTAVGPLADAVFIMTENTMHQLEMGDLYKYTENVNFDDNAMGEIWKRTFDMNKFPVTKMLAESGFYLATTEGTIFPVTDWQRLQGFFGGKTTSTMKAYLDQMRQENEQSYMEDGGIVISMEDMVHRGVFWEDFNTKNPYFPLAEETKMHANNYLFTLLAGANNTPSFDYGEKENDPRKPNPNFVTTWAFALKNYPNSNLSKQIKSFVELIEKGGGKKSHAIDAFIEDFMKKNRL